MIMQER